MRAKMAGKLREEVLAPAAGCGMLETMTKRRRRLLVALVALVAGGLFCLFLAVVLHSPSDLMKGLAQVQLGMSESEVQALLGRPADGTADFKKAKPTVEGVEVEYVRMWWNFGLTQTESAAIEFSAEGKVLKKAGGLSRDGSWCAWALQAFGF
jgi:hypothetical protein